LQAKGEHPAPCARHCEATAFRIVIRNLKAQLAQPAVQQEPVADRAFLERVLAAMENVIDVADRKTNEFDSLRACIVDLTLMLHSPQTAQPAPVQDPAEHPTNEELEDLWHGSHFGHPADFAADVLERWGGAPSGLMGHGGSLNKPAAPQPAQQELTNIERHERNLQKFLAEQPAQQEPVTDEENEKFSRDVRNFKGTDEGATMYALERFLKNRTAPQPAQQQQPADTAFTVTIEGSALKMLDDMISPSLDDECNPVRLIAGRGHSGYGLYVCSEDYPEEGADLLAKIPQLYSAGEKA
jgi:hypothetical protein